MTTQNRSDTIPVQISTIYTDEELLTLRDKVHKTACDKGWWKKDESGKRTLDPNDGLIEKLFLIVSELAEAYECYRDKNYESMSQIYAISKNDKTPIPWLESANEVEMAGEVKPEGFPVEMADAFIRVLDLMGALELVPKSIVLDPIEGSPEALTRPTVHIWSILKAIVEADYVTDKNEDSEDLVLSLVLQEISDSCVALNINLRRAINLKIIYNDTRPIRHGGKRA